MSKKANREFASRGGKAGTGESKRRGSSEYYRQLALKAVAKRRANKKLATASRSG